MGGVPQLALFAVLVCFGLVAEGALFALALVLPALTWAAARLRRRGHVS